MPERCVPVIPVRLVYLCDICGEPMRKVGHWGCGKGIASPWLHRCRNKHEVSLTGAYPRIEYREAPRE